MSAATWSQQVSWWSVHEFVAAHLQVERWPLAGSAQWRQLDDDDPVKWAGILDAARHHALRIETCQQAQADAAKEISASADWSHIAQYIRDGEEFYSAKPWLRRVTS